MEETTLFGDKFVVEAMNRKSCGKHKMPIGIPCWHLDTVFGFRPAICGKRAKQAGYVGAISRKSRGL
jgi:hypothetical protein